MFTQTILKPQKVKIFEQQNLESVRTDEKRVCAIAFEMDIGALRLNYGDPYNNAYSEIGKILQRNGFTRQRGSVYFGNENINSVTCVLAVIELSRSLSWFAGSVRDIRMLRIEELNDLMPAVQQGNIQRL